MTVRIYKPVLT